MRKQIRVMFLADITALTSDKLSPKLRRLTAPDELKKTLQVYFPDMDENSILLIDGEHIPAAVKSDAAPYASACAETKNRQACLRSRPRSQMKSKNARKISSSCT